MLHREASSSSMLPKEPSSPNSMLNREASSSHTRIHREPSSARRVTFDIEEPSEEDHTPQAYRAGEAVIQQSAQVISATGEAILDGSKVVAGVLRDGGEKLISTAVADINELGADITSEFAKFQFHAHEGEQWTDVLGRLWFIVFLMLNVLVLVGATIYIFVFHNGMFEPLMSLQCSLLFR